MPKIRKTKDGKYQYFDRAGQPVGKPQKTRKQAQSMESRVRMSPKVKKGKKK